MAVTSTGHCGDSAFWHIVTLLFFTSHKLCAFFSDFLFPSIFKHASQGVYGKDHVSKEPKLARDY